MTKLFELFMGKHVLEMCDLIDKTFPESSEEMEIIKKGIDAITTRSMLLGWFFGFITWLILLITTILIIKGG